MKHSGISDGTLIPPFLTRGEAKQDCKTSADT